MFEDTVSKIENSSLNISTVKNFLSYLFSVLQVYIPFSNIDNMVDILVNSNTNQILKAQIYSVENKQNMLNFTKILANLSNFNNLHYQTKDVYLGDPHNLRLIQETIR